MENATNDIGSMYKAMPAHYGFTFTETFHHKPKDSIDPAAVSLPEGFTVVISGASYGIGEHIAKAYAHAKASTIIIVARTESKLNKIKDELKAIASNHGKDIKILVVAGDVAKPETSQSIKNLLESECSGRLDCLVCNAGGGVTGKNVWMKHIHETIVDEYEYATMLNYLAAYYAAKYLIPLMLNPQGVEKTIINISSGAAHLTQQNPHGYSMAKFALIRMTQDIGENYVDEGLVAFSLHPGAVMTPGSVAGTEEISDLAKAMCIDDVGLCGAMCVQLSLGNHAWMSGRYISSNWDLDELALMKDDIVQHDKLKFRMAV